MDDRRFDALVRSLGRGGSRRSVLRAFLGLGAVSAGAQLVETDAARRPTPTPGTQRCPGNQEPCATGCCCPDGSTKCGSDCCPEGQTQCCDNACCYGECYGEELCCPFGSLVCDGQCTDWECCTDDDCPGSTCTDDHICACGEVSCDTGTCLSNGTCATTCTDSSQCPESCECLAAIDRGVAISMCADSSVVIEGGCPMNTQSCPSGFACFSMQCWAVCGR